MTKTFILATAASATLLAMTGTPAAAQTPATPAAGAGQRAPGPVSNPAPELPTQPSDNAMTNLVRLLAEKGVITREAGAALIQQANNEATIAKSQQAAVSGDAPPPPAGTIRVPYVPVAVRDQIKDELRNEVLAQAKAEGWAAPGQAAGDWTRKLRFYGDLRVRSQSTFYPNTNSNQMFDFATINQQGPTDVLNTPAIPYLNTRVDIPNSLRVRLRLGMDAQVGDHVTAGLMLATGDDPGPISTNTILAGGFGKRQLWVQRAYLRIQPNDWSWATFGRFDNPFMSTPLVFDEDLEFDGIVGDLELGPKIDSNLILGLRAGAFPLDFGDQNYLSTAQDKTRYPQKWMFSGQVEAGGDFGGGITARIAAAYHHFENLQGRLSEPCLIYAGAVQCSTDGLRPFFQRQGNTLSPLRQIAVDPNLPAGQIQPQPQFFGLTFNYHLLDLNAQVAFPLSDKTRVTLGGNFVKNLGFKRGDACRYGVLGQPFNNGGSNGDGNICSPTNPTSFIGGDTAWALQGQIGYDNPSKWGEWNLVAGYRYIESDAVLDSFSDDNFHNGGTNAKGYFIGGQLGIYDGLAFGGRWISANEVRGEPYAVDILQVDLMARF